MAAETLIGKVLLEQFRVDAFIAAGGMGAVYKVWDLKRQVPLAMKVLHADLAEDPSIFKRFKREANALKKLAHPNIVPFYGLYQTMDFAFLLEGYVDGPTLKDVLKRKGRLRAEEALTVLKGVSAALSYAHAHGVVHCDVKPGNVMIDRGGRVYLTDFGIARHAESTTTTFGFAGTAAYMAPEQIRGEPVTPATDVYALSVMAYELLVERRPFTGEEEGTAGTHTRAERLRMAHLKLTPPDPRQFNPEIPEKAAQVLLKALSKEPEDRYRDAWTFFEALCEAFETMPEKLGDRVLAGMEFDEQPVVAKEVVAPAAGVRAESVSQSRQASSEQAPRTSRKAMWAWGAVGIVLVVVALGFKIREGESSPARHSEAVVTTVREENRTTGSSSASTFAETETLTSAPPTWTPSPTVPPSPTPTPTNTPEPASVWEKEGYDLAFASDHRGGDFQVYLFNTHTNEAQMLDSPGKRAWWPSFCGDKVAAEVYPGGSQWIYFLNLFGNSSSLDSPVGGSATGVPRCSPDGEKIAYSAKVSVWELAVASLSGDVLYEDDSSRLAGYATWEPSGNGLYYIKRESSGYAIYHLDLRTGQNEYASPEDADGHSISSAKYPALSPDGEHLAFVCWVNSQACLCVTRPGSRSAHRIHALRGKRINGQPIPLGTPVWSADGRWIYFASAEGGDWDIYRIRSDGTGLSAITPWGSNEIMPAVP